MRRRRLDLQLEAQFQLAAPARHDLRRRRAEDAVNRTFAVLRGSRDTPKARQLRGVFEGEVVYIVVEIIGVGWPAIESL